MATILPVVMDAGMINLTYSYNEHHKTNAIDSKDSFYEPDCLKNVIYSLIVLICIPGFIGNGIVIQHLGFKIKRNPFTVYILNLAVAQSGTLIFLFLHGIQYLIDQGFHIEILEGFIWTYCTGQLFLTIISIDRCLALFFPIWYQYRQSICLSTMICCAAWIISLFIYAINYALFLTVWGKAVPPLYHFLTCTSVCAPLIAFSSLTLFVRSYLKSRMKTQEKLPKAILLALFFFLIFSLPLIDICIINVIYNEKRLKFMMYGYLFACLNSSVNPLIYFLVGRKKAYQTMCHGKMSLQRVFEEEEENEKQPIVQNDIPSCCSDKSGNNSYFYISQPGSEKLIQTNLLWKI
ncbi:PREDICTED: mas-related G-protein coupled receptor member H-like [Thamnophis sirtalis]|uniref:Mas-related G-protein coupled receptor member H-like n=1 Tax=Thamnophis sirtalis TaxID=35019 RepID=A0A6I9YNZ4_9SAUR|nr:PREDICTED: mas-related G-protein coupled receptor member H-like [Thamnophis sirtalis]